MASMMDVDTEDSPTKKVRIHPLAIVGIADHFTRVTTGGSPLEVDAPVVGLLFGHDTVVEDAEDISWRERHGAHTTTKIDLHRAVFPQQTVVGWYRVGDSPAADDLTFTQQLVQRYPEHNIIFCLMQASITSWEEGELPLTIYEMHSNKSVLVALDLELETMEPERIAIEKVVSQRAPSDNEMDTSLKSLQDTLKALNERVKLLLDFLKRTEKGEIPPNPQLLRQVKQLVQQLPVLTHKNWGHEFEREQEDMALMTYMATVTKTAAAVKGYTDKFRLIFDSAPSRESMRRAF